VAGNHLAAVMPDARTPSKSIYIEYLFVLWSLVGLHRPVGDLLLKYGVNRSSLGDEVGLGGRGRELLSLLFLVKLHKFGQIELGLLEDLSLVHEDVLEGVELGALLGDLLADLFRKKLLEEVLEGRFLGLVNHDLHHLLADVLDLRGLGVAGGLDLFVLAFGERNAEQTDKVTIGGLGLHESLNQRVPFLHKGAKLVAGDADSSEVCIALVALDFLNLELDDSPSVLMLVLLVQVRVGDLENAAFQAVSGDVLASSLVARGQSGHSNLENGGSTHVVPLLLKEGMDDLLLLLTLLFEVPWVLSGSHVLKFRSDTHRGGLPSY